MSNGLITREGVPNMVYQLKALTDQGFREDGELQVQKRNASGIMLPHPAPKTWNLKKRSVAYYRGLPFSQYLSIYISSFHSKSTISFDRKGTSDSQNDARVWLRLQAAPQRVWLVHQSRWRYVPDRRKSPLHAQRALTRRTSLLWPSLQNYR